MKSLPARFVGPRQSLHFSHVPCFNRQLHLRLIFWLRGDVLRLHAINKDFPATIMIFFFEQFSPNEHEDQVAKTLPILPRQSCSQRGSVIADQSSPLFCFQGQRKDPRQPCAPPPPLRAFTHFMMNPRLRRVTLHKPSLPSEPFFGQKPSNGRCKVFFFHYFLTPQAPKTPFSPVWIPPQLPRFRMTPNP